MAALRCVRERAILRDVMILHSVDAACARVGAGAQNRALQMLHARIVASGLRHAAENERHGVIVYAMPATACFIMPARGALRYVVVVAMFYFAFAIFVMPAFFFFFIYYAYMPAYYAAMLLYADILRHADLLFITLILRFMMILILYYYYFRHIDTL